jgi:hypothetical protein
VEDGMTDKELLELAAKAAGLSKDFKYSECARAMITRLPSGITAMRWNPLTDDGDALRLAVKLRFIVDNAVGKFGDRPDAAAGTDEHHKNPVFVSQYHEDDPYAATRRAIVRAAAEIGKAMP